MEYIGRVLQSCESSKIAPKSQRSNFGGASPADGAFKTTKTLRNDAVAPERAFLKVLQKLNYAGQSCARWNTALDPSMLNVCQDVTPVVCYGSGLYELQTLAQGCGLWTNPFASSGPSLESICLVIFAKKQVQSGVCTRGCVHQPAWRRYIPSFLLTYTLPGLQGFS